MTFIEFEKHLVPLECTSDEFLERWENGDVAVGIGTTPIRIAGAPMGLFSGLPSHCCPMPQRCEH